MQQWELLASPGHVLLTRVDEYRRKLQLPVLVFAGAVLVTLAAAPVAYLIAEAGGGLVEWVVRKGGGIVASPPAKSPAPQLKAIRIVVPSGFTTTLDTVPDLDTDVIPAMNAQVVAAGAGKRLNECDFTRKIDADWASAGDISPRCRYSKDGNRLWVWSLVKQDGKLRPWMGLIRKDGGKASLAQITVSGAALSGSVPAKLDPKQIPRAIAADFPELVVAQGDQK